MANQNFRVKKGLEVGLGATALFADDTGVGINSIEPRGNLDVRGDAYIQELQVGPSSAGIGSTSLFVDGGTFIDGDVVITGDIIFDDAILDDLVVTGLSSLNSVTFNDGVGTALTLTDLNVENIEIDGTDFNVTDPTFESLSVTGFSTFGGLNTTGFSTFYQNLRVQENLFVGGNIELEDLGAGNISVAGTVTTNGLVFNVGIGTSLALEKLNVEDIEIDGTEFDVTDPTFESLSVTGFSTFGGLNTTGFSTFYQNVRIDKDLEVGGNISLDDLDSGNISVGGTITTNSLVFNVGIGTTAQFENLIVTGISSLQTITGFGSELQFLPAGSISTSVGIGSTIPPSIRPTGEPIQAGDLWFDAQDLRQYTYYIDPNGDAQWVDSNPPPTQPSLRFIGDDGEIGEVDIQNSIFSITGKENQILTDAIPNTPDIEVGLSTNVVIDGSLSVGTTAFFGDSVAIGNTLFVTSDVVIGGGITFQGDITVEIDTELIGNVNVQGIATFNELNFNVGIGTSLTLENLTVTGEIDANGTGIATIGGSPSFENLTVTGITTLGFTTVQGDLNVTGDLIVNDDIIFDEATLRKINVSGLASLNQLTYNVGVAKTLTVQERLFVDTAEVDLNSDIRVGGASTFVGFATFQNGLSVLGNLNVTGDIVSSDATYTDLTVEQTLTSDNDLQGNRGNFKELTVTDNFRSNGTATLFTVGVQTVSISTELSVSGLTTFTGAFEFGEAEGFDLTVQNLTVPFDGNVSLPGVAFTDKDVVFPNIEVLGISTLRGFVDINDNVDISGITTIGSNIKIDGGNRRIDVGTSFIQGGSAIPFVEAEISSGKATFAQLVVTSNSAESTFAGDVEVTGELQVSAASTFAALSAQSIDVANSITIGDNLTVDNNLEVKERTDLKDLYVTGIASLNGASFGDGGVATFESINVVGLSSLGGDVDIAGALGVSGLTTMTDLIVTGVATIGLVSANNLEFTTANGNAITVQSLTVPPGGVVSLPDIPVSGGEATFSRLNVTGLSTFGGISTFQSDVFVDGNLLVKGSQVFQGGAQATNFNVTGITTTENLKVGGASTFVGLGTFQNDLYVADDLFVKQNLVVGGIATFQDVIVNGNLTGSGEGSAIIIDGNSVISGIVTIGPASITLNGLPGQENIEIGTGSGNIIAGLNTFTNDPSHVKVDEGRFNTFITVSGVGSTSVFKGNVEVEGNITAEDINSTSDRRVKENVKPIKNALDKISQLNGITFSFINTGTKSAGVIAQEVESVFPDMVKGDFPKSVNYNGLIGALIESIKELKEQNELLKERIEKLES